MDPNQEAEKLERENFFRMTLLLFRVGNQRLREFFKTRWPIVYQNKTGISPPAPWTDIPNDASEMKKQETKPLRFQFKDQEKLFDSGNTNKWDFSLLTTVLNNSTLGFVTSSSSESHAIKDLKDIRNKLIGHATDAKIPNMLYNIEWPKACSALKKFKATQGEIDQVVEDIKKPIDALLPLLKELLDTEKEILDAVNQLEERNKRRHAEVLETVKVESEDVKETIRTEVNKLLETVERFPETKRRCSKDLRMREEQRVLLQERVKHFQREITATELFEYLPCLSDEQKDRIAYYEKNYTQESVVKTLVEELETCENGFDMFVRALLKNNLGHIAVLLDPDCDELISHDSTTEDTNDNNYHFIGTVVAIPITIRIEDAETESRKTDMEEQIATQFSSSISEECKRLRRAFLEVLPSGVYLDCTKQLGKKTKDSVVFLFRLAKVTVLDEFWNICESDDLIGHIKDVLNKTLEKPLDDVKLKVSFHEEVYEDIRKRLQQGATTDSSSQDDADEQMEVSEMAEVTDMFQKLNIPKVYLEGEYHREICLRDYQKELAAPALEGKNTIICAPTNSGKTFVAMEIAKRHLDEHMDTASKGRKVLFVVNKQNLVLQQRTRFEEYLSEKAISDLSGNNSGTISLDSLLSNCDVVVLTAQILVNALEDKSVKISDISLLMFDECHHTQKGTPYNKIMINYIAMKRNNKETIPQVVGLTASLGVGQSSSLLKAVDHVLQICANLDASCISTVRDNMEDLVSHVTGDVPDMKVITVENDEQNVFEEEVNKAMSQIETKYLIKEFSDPPTDRQCEAYRQWVENCKKELVSLAQNRIEQYTCAEHLISYHEALLINNFTRIEDGLAHLAECFTFNQHSQSQLTEKCSWLSDVYQETKTVVQERASELQNSNPLYSKLEELIAEFHGKDEGKSKGIVFCRTKAYAVALKRCIDETEKLKDILRPDVLVGGAGEVSMTQSQQESVIKNFKDGSINVIIATSVAEEGLDISDCKYVIRYGVKTNEISRRQARGRIRAKEGTYVYLSDTRSRGADHELKSKSKEKLMDQAVEEVQKMKRELFNEKVRSIQAKIIITTTTKSEDTSSLKPTSIDKSQSPSFHCKKCSALICHEYELRTYKKVHHVVVKDINERLEISSHQKPYEDSSYVIRNKIHCKKLDCKLDWGVIITIQDTDWPCIKAKSIKVKESNNGRFKTFKKWGEYSRPIIDTDSAEELIAAQEGLE